MAQQGGGDQLLHTPSLTKYLALILDETSLPLNPDFEDQGVHSPEKLHTPYKIHT